MYEVTIRQADTGMVMAQEVYDDERSAGRALGRAMRSARKVAGDWDVEVVDSGEGLISVDRYRGGELVVA